MFTYLGLNFATHTQQTDRLIGQGIYLVSIADLYKYVSLIYVENYEGKLPQNMVTGYNTSTGLIEWYGWYIFFLMDKIGVTLTLRYKYTVKPVCNDHLYDKIYYLFFYSVMCFNEDWRYQFTFANNFCLLELI